MTYPIDTILDDNLLVADMLRSLGIKTTAQLWSRGADIKTRRRLAGQILDWVTAADLTRINGVGRTYARLLQECSVRTIRELSYRSARNLTDEMQTINGRLGIVEGPLPSIVSVALWIEEAKTLPWEVTYR